MPWLLLPVLLALMLVTSGCIVQPIVAGEEGALPLPPSTEPIIVIAPIAAASGDTVSVGGAGWLAGDTVYVNLEGNQDGVPVGAALTVTTVDAEGRFMASFKVPLDLFWRDVTDLVVIARSLQTEESASAPFILLIGAAAPQPATATATATQTPIPRATPTPVPTATDQASVTSRGLNLRAGPSTAYSVIRTLSYGTVMKVLGQDASGSWLYVRLADGTTGWVARSFTTYTGVAPVVPAPPLPTPIYYTPTPLPTSAYDVWYGEYFANRSLSGTPTLIRNDPAIDFYWNYTSPGPGLPVANFSARWAQSRYFDAGTYRFYLSSRDGIRMWVDGASVLNEWRDGPAGPYVVDVALTSGVHLLQVAYYSRSSQAYVSVSWQRLESTPVPGYPDWKGEYFSNRDLSGSPGYVRNDTSVDFDWGTASPAPGLPNTNYSVRWTRTIDFSSGTYRFYARSDDGIRVYVEGDRIINEWHDSSGSTTYTADKSLSGRKQIVVEFYQRNGPALVKFSWERIRKTATPTKTPTPTPLPTRSAYADASPASGPAGTSVTVSIGAFPANTTVNLYLGGLVRAAEAAANTVYATTTTDRFGNGVLRFTLPATWPDGAPIKAGKLQLLAATADFSATAGATFDFTEPRPTVAPVPYAVVSPDSGGPGTQVELRGGGFPANRGLNIYLGTVVKGMTAAAALPPYVTTNSDANGNYVTTFSMPDKWPDGSTVETGKLVILVATGDFSAEASATFDYFRQAPNPAIQLSPGSGGPGTLVTVSGSGFPRNTVVNVYLATLDAQTGGGPLQSYAGGKTDGAGRFTVTFGIPATWPNGSPVSQDRLVVTAATDGFSVEVSALFVNTAPGPTWTPTPTPTPTTTPQPPTPTPTPTRMPSVQLTPQAGTAGTVVKASGSGFPVNTAVYARLAVLGASSPEGPIYERYATATTDINGSYSMTFTMPATWPSGQRIATGRLVVLISTLDFAYQASATFDYTEVSAAEEEPAPVPTATDTPVPPPVEPTATQTPVEEATATWTVEPPTAPPPEEGTDAPEDGTPPP